MEFPKIQIFNEHNFPLPFDEKQALTVLSLIEENEPCQFAFIELVFVDAKNIIKINKEYLGHNYVTDIITFSYDSDKPGELIEGTIYCCAPRITEQAKEFGETEEREFFRILIHGLLHLNGYEDNSEALKETMRARENFYLDRYFQNT